VDWIYGRYSGHLRWAGMDEWRCFAGMSGTRFTKLELLPPQESNMVKPGMWMLNTVTALDKLGVKLLLMLFSTTNVKISKMLDRRF